ncbi:MAG: YggS family pyridoxal phosphate-dependent enzyme [Firmicutes bacterium]|nr:YggS family pyridoxal phosphate-dependent enzyme [Bacillota bacterium]
MEVMQKRIEEIRRKIAMAAQRSGRRDQEVTLVAVSKMVGEAEVRNAYDLGIRDFGENRVQELNRKMEYLPQARWHLIGRLQTNKVKDVVGRASLIHSLDSWPLALAINQRAQKLGIVVPVLVQVNISEEASKAGLSAVELDCFLDSVGELSALQIQGLMTIAVQESLPEASRSVFRELAQLRHKLQGKKYRNVELKYLSMGMSQDYEVAVEEGANLVRIGSALFI